MSQLKKLSAALGLALSIPLAADAANLGRLTVLSALGQPLRAEIEVTAVSAEEARNLSAKLASADAFSRANVDFNPVLSSLSFAVEQRQGRHFIRISSSQPVSDPFVDLLLELNAGNSRSVREYTFLLDPSDSKAPRNAQVAPLTPSTAEKSAPASNAASAASVPAQSQAAAPVPAPASAQAPAPAAAAPAPAAPAATPAPAQAQPPAIPVSNDEPVPTIVRRDAPSAYAEEIIRRRQDEAAAPQAAPAPASQPAPAATGSGNVARPATATAAPATSTEYTVKQGDTLAAIASRNKPANVSLDQMLIALYRANPDAFMGNNINRLKAGKILSVPDQQTASAVDQGEARGMVVAQAQDFNAYRDKLASQVANGPARNQEEGRQSGKGKITTRVEERSGTSGAQDKLELSRANSGKGSAGNAGAAEDKAASERALAEANDRVKELEKNVGDLQKLLEMKNKTIADLSTQAKPAEQAAPAAEAKPEAAAEAKPEEKPEEKPAEAAPAPTEAAPAAPPAAEATPVPAVPATPAEPAAAKPDDKAKQGFFSNPYVLPGIGGGLAAIVLAGLAVFMARRRKKDAEAEPAEEKPKDSEPAPVAAAVIAETEAESDAGDSGEAAAAAETQVDPLAEADMYIAYGRDEQAEDILKLALQTQPERQALHSKLLEIYAKREDVAAFNKAAGELHQLSNGEGEEWGKAVALGIVLDPTNPLYGGKPVEVAPEPEPVAEVATPAEQDDDGLDFDLDDFKAAEIQPSAAPAVDLGKDIDFDLDLDSGTKLMDDEPILPTMAPSASALLDDVDDQPAVSLSDLDLDLPGDTAAGESSAATSSASNILEEDEESAFEAEMTTKLDLAAAYQEIGDKEGARELLEEVMRGGNDGQVARAKDMLSKLS